MPIGLSDIKNWSTQQVSTVRTRSRLKRLASNACRIWALAIFAWVSRKYVVLSCHEPLVCSNIQWLVDLVVYVCVLQVFLKFDDYDELERELFINIEREKKLSTDNVNSDSKKETTDHDAFLSNRKRISELLPPPINIRTSVSMTRRLFSFFSHQPIYQNNRHFKKWFSHSLSEKDT